MYTDDMNILAIPLFCRILGLLKKIDRKPMLCLFTAGLASSFGCQSSSPQTRIADNAEAFSAMDEGVKTLIRKGQINIGFSKTQVNLAWGPPSRKIQKRTIEGNREIWVYNGTKYRMVDTGYSPYGHPGLTRRTRSGYARTLDDQITRNRFQHIPVSYEKSRIVFNDGLVEEIEVNQSAWKK